MPRGLLLLEAKMDFREVVVVIFGTLFKLWWLWSAMGFFGWFVIESEASNDAGLVDMIKRRGS